MDGIHELIRDVIERLVLPRIERDGIRNLLLPEQITPAHCAKPVRLKRPCKLRGRDHELGIGLTGRAVYCVENKPFVFTPGRMLLLPGGTLRGPAQEIRRFPQTINPDRPSSFFWLRGYTSGAWVQIVRIAGGGDVFEANRPFLLVGRYFSRLMVCLLEEARDRQPYYERVGRHILLEMMDRCLRAASSTAETLASPTGRFHTASGVGELARVLHIEDGEKAARADLSGLPTAVRTAQEFIDSNYNRAVSLDEIAEAANISPTPLGRQFKAATGMTPITYLLQVRMAAAKQLLLTGMKVAEVGSLVGIENPGYFSRLFRRLNGVRPLQYRRRMARKAGGDISPRRRQGSRR